MWGSSLVFISTAGLGTSRFWLHWRERNNLLCFRSSEICWQKLGKVGKRRHKTTGWKAWFRLEKAGHRAAFSGWWHRILRERKREWQKNDYCVGGKYLQASESLILLLFKCMFRDWKGSLRRWLLYTEVWWDSLNGERSSSCWFCRRMRWERLARWRWHWKRSVSFLWRQQCSAMQTCPSDWRQFWTNRVQRVAQARNILF